MAEKDWREDKRVLRPMVRTGRYDCVGEEAHSWGTAKNISTGRGIRIHYA